MWEVIPVEFKMLGLGALVFTTGVMLGIIVGTTPRRLR